MRHFFISIPVLACLCCNPLLADEDEAVAVRQRTAAILQANDRLEKAEKDLSNGRLAEAENGLRELRDQPYFHREIDQMLEQIERVRRSPALKRAQTVSDARAIDEVTERLILPDKYGETKIIHPETGFNALPMGRMERLAAKPVTFSVQDADLRTLIMTLSSIDGLNIIADDALTADKTLSINATEVPLQEILGYIARNMGVAFHFGENVIWVTAVEEEEAPKGPVLETRMYHLTKGQIPAVSSGGGNNNNGGGGGFGGGGFGGGNNSFGGGNNSFGGGGGGGNSSSSASGSAGEDDVFTALTDFLDSNPDSPEDALFKVYRNRNLVLIRNTRENLRLAEELIKAFDAVPAQILIEARYLTIGQKDLKQLGTTIDKLSYVSPSGQADVDASSLLPGFPTNVNSPGKLQVSGVINRVTYSAILEALEQMSSSQTMSAPRVTVFNNHTARLRRGENRFYFDQFDQQTTGGQNPVTSTVPSGTAQELQLGITLEATPSVGTDLNTINLGLTAAIVDFIRFEALTADISLPVTDENSITTVLAVNSGETVVMGGMISSDTAKSRSQIPILGNIPGLGFLFRKIENSSTPEHLLIFVTATIIDPDGRFNTVEKSDRPLIRNR